MVSAFEVISGVASCFTTPWWTGVPTKLLQKQVMVKPSSPIDSNDYKTTKHLAVHTLTFEIPQNVQFSGRACAHKDIQLDHGDVIKMVIPGFKPKSYSLSDVRPEQNEMDITIKVYPNGRASGFLDRLQIGETVNSFGMHSGRRRNAGKFFGGIAFGVGITEILPVAEAELQKGDAEKVVVLWASRTSGDTFWQDKIALLEKQYPDKFEMVYIYSREESADPAVLKGRVDENVLQKVFMSRIEKSNISHEDARFLSVGTKQMMYNTSSMLGNIGYPMHKHGLLTR
jgi:NAD(P)H-flavin reductase